MRKAETTIVAKVVVNLIGVKLMRLIDADEFQKQIAGMAIEIVKRGGLDAASGKV